MAFTVQDVLDEVAVEFNSIPPANALRYFNVAHGKICRNVRLYPDDAVDVSLVADQRYYAFDPDILRVWHVAYYTAATSYENLEETSPDELDYEAVGWRGWASGTPYKWFEEGSNIGLIDIPDTTTSGGYPKLTMYVQTRRTLTVLDTLPAQIVEMDAWVNEICFQWAKRKAKDKAADYLALSKRSMSDLQTQIYGRAARQKPTVRYDVPTVRH